MNNLTTNPERTAKLIKTLMDWYRMSRDGPLENAELPETKPPDGVTRGSYEHIMFLTLTVAIDYQRSAAKLWDSARKTWEDKETRWVFCPKEVADRGLKQLEAALKKHELSKKQKKDAEIWRKVASSFQSLFQGDPRKLFKKCSFDALEIYKAMRGRYAKQFPYLAGATGTSKILSLWIRILKDEANITFNNLDKVPIPMDIHTVRATITTGCLVGRFEGTFKELAVQAQEAWMEACRNTEYYPLQLDAPLWNLGKLGCSKRKKGSVCPEKNKCRLAVYCTATTSDAKIELCQNGNTLIDTKYPERQL